MMLQNGSPGLAAKDVFITPVGRRRLLVELLLVERQRFIGDVVVRIRTAAVAALGKYERLIPDNESEYLLE